MLKADYVWHVVEIVIGGVPTILEVNCMCLFLSLSMRLLQGSVSTNLFDRMRPPVVLQIVDVGI